VTKPLTADRRVIVKHLLAIVLGTAALALTLGTAQAQDAETTIKARQSHMRLNSFNLGPLGAMAKGEIPYDAAVASAAAGNLAALAAMDQGRLWAKGTGQPENDGTRALAAIWESSDDFATKIEGLANATAALADAAGTDLAALQVGMGEVGKACSACHKTFRAEKK
jgi:cytochrome c556